MATAYLRPSADISLQHSVSSGSTGYNLINESSCDSDSTYLYLSVSDDSITKVSQFTCTGTITSGHRITSAKAIVYAKYEDSDINSSTVAVAVGSSSSTQNVTNTSYTAYTYTLSSSDITVNGTTATATLTLTSYLSDGDSKNTYYQRISQVYIEVETASAVQYTITTTTKGTGTITADSTVYINDNSTVKIYPGSNLSITSLTDNNTDVTSSISYITPTPAYSVTAQASGASYGFTQGSTYWTSNNAGTNQSAAICQINFVCEVAATITFAFINYAESTYDYGIIGAVDQTLGTSYSADSNVAWEGSSSSANKSTEQTTTISMPSGSHFIQIKYRKDQATSENNDNFQWRISNLAYTTTVTPYYSYTLTNVTTNHSLVCIFSDYVACPAWIKLDGSWLHCTSFWVKSNGTWVKKEDPITTYNYIRRQHNPWTFDATLPKDAGLTTTSDWFTTEFLPISPNTEIIVTGAQCTVGVGFVCYNQDYSYNDWWSLTASNSTVIVTDTIFQRTLDATNVSSCYWVKINIPKAYYTYCKLEQSGNVIFDGTLYPYS